VIRGADLKHGLSLYRRLYGYVRPYRGIFVIALIGMMVNGATLSTFAYLIKPLISHGFVDHDQGKVLLLCLELVALFVARGIAGFVGTYGIRWVGRKVIYDMRKDMFARILQLPAAFFDHNKSASLVSKFVYDVEQLAMATTTAVTVLIKDSATVIGCIVVMLWLEWRLTVLLFVVAPVLAILVRVASRRMRVVSRSIQSTIGMVADAAKEAIQAHRVVKTFGGEAQEQARFARANNRNRQQAMRKAKVAAISPAIIELLAALVVSFIIYVAAMPQLKFGPSEFSSFISAIVFMMGSARHLTKILEPVQTGMAAAESGFALIDEMTEPDHGTATLGRARGEIEYRDVSFRYSTARRRVLHDISFHVEPGQTIALVGPSGSGKTSIASLLARFYEPESGAILVDGHDVSTLKLDELRRNLSVVTQETLLFNDTIAANIAYGAAGGIDGARLAHAATAAHVTEFAGSLPDGLETLVGEHGLQVSGGQRQRIAIARALYKDAPILILDEATSALDAESERQVQDAIRNLIRNRTTLIIAHRLSTIEHADRILVLRQGRIVESGTHAELLGRAGTYASLYRTQLVGEAAH